MNLFKIWSKSGAAITLKGLGISDAEAHKIINNAPDSFINSIRKITSSLSRKQKNIILAWACIIYFQESTQQFHHLLKIQHLATGVRFHIFNNFDFDDLKVAYHQTMMVTCEALGNFIENDEVMTRTEMIDSFDMDELKEEFSI